MTLVNSWLIGPWPRLPSQSSSKETIPGLSCATLPCMPVVITNRCEECLCFQARAYVWWRGGGHSSSVTDILKPAGASKQTEAGREKESVWRGLKVGWRSALGGLCRVHDVNCNATVGKQMITLLFWVYSQRRQFIRLYWHLQEQCLMIHCLWFGSLWHGGRQLTLGVHRHEIKGRVHGKTEMQSHYFMNSYLFGYLKTAFKSGNEGNHKSPGVLLLKCYENSYLNTHCIVHKPKQYIGV